MKCPVCKDISLQISNREGVEIDYCPECRGVWLDRGELDKLIERSSSYNSVNRESDRRDYKESNNRDDYRGDQQKNYDGKYHKKKESIWGEIFDF